MWRLRLIGLFIDIILVENMIFKKIYSYFHVAFGAAWGPRICDWSGLYLTSLRPWVTVLLVHRSGLLWHCGSRCHLA
jgi:hypothetical protein